jgi:exonuclease VII small subunit
VAENIKIELVVVDKTSRALGNVNKQMKGLQTSGIKLTSVLKGAGLALLAIGTGRLIKGIVGTTARFEDLNDALSSVTGSAEAGAQAFDFVSNFATKTQFGVEDLTTTFIKLKASGIEPTEDLLTLFTDTAAVTTDQLGSLQAITDLFARTTSGGLGLEELNRLADRGVPVFRILEEQLGLARLQISEVGKTAEGSKKILNALSKGLRADFGGATANVVDNLSTQFSNLSIALKNSADEFGQGLSPVLKDTTAELTSFIENNEDTIAALGRLGGAILQGVVKLFIGLAEALGAIVIGGEKLIGFFKKVQEDTDHIHDDFSMLNSDFDSTGFALAGITEAAGPVVEQLGDMQMESEELGKTLNEVKNETLGLNNAMGDFNETGKTTNDLLKEQAIEQAAANREAAIMNRSFKKQDAQLKMVNKSIKNYKDGLEKMNKEYEAGVVITDTLMNATRSFATTTESALTDVFMGAKTLREALGDIGQAIVRDLVGGLIRLFVVGPILQKLADIFGIDMVNGTMKQVDAQKKLNRELKVEIGLRTALMFLTGGIRLPSFRADGGPVSKNQPYIVGEEGPELFVPNKTGTIVPNNMMPQADPSSGSAMGGDVTVNFNINTVDAAGMDELLVDRRTTIVGIINQALNQRGRVGVTNG